MEKTMTFNVTDALISPMGLALLSGAGFAEDTAKKHVHLTLDIKLDDNHVAKIEYSKLAEELGTADTPIYLCNDSAVRPYACKLDANGAITDWADTLYFCDSTGTKIGTTTDEISVTSNTPTYIGIFNGDTLVEATGTYKFDLYAVMTTGATEITIEPGDFGGYFYVEADTLYRNESGKDMSATLTFPKVKIQSGFTITMAATGDPSTFDFVMDAFPGYTYFDSTKKVCCDITIVSGDTTTTDSIYHETKHTLPASTTAQG